MWQNLTSASTYAGPAGKIGLSSAYDFLLQKLLIFGGSAPLSALAPSGAGSATYDSWIYDTKLQKWTQFTSNFNVDTNLQRVFDFASGTQVQWQKPDGARALFGYAAVPGMAISQLSSTGQVGSAAGNAPIDTTDRLITLGGQGSYCALGICRDTHRFNPTFGPEYVDTYNAQAPTIDPQNAVPFPIQWIDSYPSQIMSNGITSSQYIPSKFPAPVPPNSDTPTSINFGAVGLSNNNSGTSGLLGAGYLLTAGGFYGYTDSSGNINTPSGSCNTLSKCGGMQLSLKWYRTDGAHSWSQNNEKYASNFTAITNQNDIIGSQQTPTRWFQIPRDTPTADTTPWFGSGVLLKGINITSNAANEVVYFGGSDCKYFLTDATTCSSGTWPTQYNPGAYWVMGQDPASTFNPSASNYPSNITMTGSGTAPYLPPRNAGMSAARGLDPSGNPIIVAWGGMSATTVQDNSGYIYYLYNQSGTPTWGYYLVPTGSGPAGLTNASLVYSHVTKKFYLYGGYSPTLGTVGNVWELSVSSTGNSANCGVQTSASCIFTWRLIDSTVGQTCYPNCPTARRAHRMVEVNYNNYTLSSNPAAEPTCNSASQPCSFGIFMQGGTAEGTNFLSDRWMFDPTANSGAGHWQLVSEFPPRTLAALSNVDYTIPSNGTVAHRAVLFGGETGLQSPAGIPGAAGTGYFVPPTLGDTWMYDYDTNSWNRVTLYGRRFDSSFAPSFPLMSETDARASSLITDTSTSLLSPPPVSGAIMVNRTLSKANHLATERSTTLAIPEIFLFGGRKKDGTYQTYRQVFKFCAGSTGEKPYPNSLKGTGVPAPDDASCDAYDATTNPNSPSPAAGYVGRWLYKTPSDTAPFNSADTGSFMGAGAYDTLHDLIVLYGGMKPATASAAITDSTQWAADSKLIEYTPPSRTAATSTTSQINGSYAVIPACTCVSTSPCPEPTARYGHTFAYDSHIQSLVVAGGYDISGNPLTQTQTYKDGRTYQIPEVWTAKRMDSDQTSTSAVDSTNSTFPCYYWSQVTLFGNSIDDSATAPPLTGIAHATSIYIPSNGYGTGFYTTFDNSCINSGPIYSQDPNVSKLLAGGAYIDIDRSQLERNENLILNLTFLPLGPLNTHSDQNYLATTETAVFKVHLIKTGQSGDTIRQQLQPRYRTYAGTDQFPEVVQDVAVLAPPTGYPRQEQIYLPLSTDPGIDRIRIERYSGNAILIDASIYRLGQFTE
jgi:hypothetical protein